MLQLQDTDYNFDKDIEFLSYWGELKHNGELVGHHLYLGNNFTCLSYFTNIENPEQDGYSWEVRHAQNTGDVIVGSGKNGADYYIANCKDALKYYLWYCESEELEKYFTAKNLQKFL